MTAADLPAVNASLNGLATLMLLGGWWAIKFRKNTQLHRNFMSAALVSSVLFLSCYLYYHYSIGGGTRYEEQGILRIIYFTILLTHIPLAVVMVPFIVMAVWHAVRGQFDRHKKIVRWVWPVWMYVSVTGVMIYVMLYQL